MVKLYVVSVREEDNDKYYVKLMELGDNEAMQKAKAFSRIKELSELEIKLKSSIKSLEGKQDLKNALILSNTQRYAKRAYKTLSLWTRIYQGINGPTHTYLYDAEECPKQGSILDYLNISAEENELQESPVAL